MAKSRKMIVCKTCNNPIAAKAKVCPHCGAKNKKPLFKRKWFIFLMLIIILSVIGSIGGKLKKRGERFSWADIELGSILPEPKSHIGRIDSNSDDRLSIYVQKSSREDYKNYLSECQDKGFMIESDKSETQYYAYNEEGYELSLAYDEGDKELYINLDAPMEMNTLQWPTSDLVSLLPVPKSTVGAISRETSDMFFVYVGETPLDDYNDYVNECSASGFSVNYDKGDKYYYADNESGYHITLRYQGNNVMSIEIEKPEETSETTVPDTVGKTTDNSSVNETANNSPVNETTDEPSTDESVPGSDTSEELVDGLRPEFKEAMDSYEAFYDEYCAFMEQYNENPTDLTLIGKYADMLTRLSEMNEKFEAWEDEDLNDAELKYYLEMHSRIFAKLADVAS